MLVILIKHFTQIFITQTIKRTLKFNIFIGNSFLLISFQMFILRITLHLIKGVIQTPCIFDSLAHPIINCLQIADARLFHIIEVIPFFFQYFVKFLHFLGLPLPPFGPHLIDLGIDVYFLFFFFQFIHDLIVHFHLVCFVFFCLFFCCANVFFCRGSNFCCYVFFEDLFAVFVIAVFGFWIDCA